MSLPARQVTQGGRLACLANRRQQQINSGDARTKDCLKVFYEMWGAKAKVTPVGPTPHGCQGECSSGHHMHELILDSTRWLLTSRNRHFQVHDSPTDFLFRPRPALPSAGRAGQVKVATDHRPIGSLTPSNPQTVHVESHALFVDLQSRGSMNPEPLFPEGA